MAVAYINKTIELPTVTAQRISREMVGERSSTALGKLRQDVVRVRRAWRLECRFLTNAQYTAIISHMESVSWAAVPFWLDDPRRPEPLAPLAAPATADLLVVGGGFSGLWTALQAKEADPARDVLLVEGGRIGWALFPTLEEAMVFKNLNINYFSCTAAYNQEGARLGLESPESPVYFYL